MTRCLTLARRLELAPQRAAARRPSTYVERIFASRAADFAIGPFAGPVPSRVAPPRGIEPQHWRGPDWYWVRHDTHGVSVLQLCFVEADGRLSAFDEIDEEA